MAYVCSLRYERGVLIFRAGFSKDHYRCDYLYVRVATPAKRFVFLRAIQKYCNIGENWIIFRRNIFVSIFIGNDLLQAFQHAVHTMWLHTSTRDEGQRQIRPVGSN